jgi:uncharacterized repeat protein (TIGR03803 family)
LEHAKTCGNVIALCRTARLRTLNNQIVKPRGIMTFVPAPVARSISKPLFAIMTLGLLALLTTTVSAQNYRIIYVFSGGAGGMFPDPLSIDRYGNLYAPTAGGYTGNQFCRTEGGCGTAWKFYLRGSNWLGDELYTFTAGADGYGPLTPIAVAPSGIAYGGMVGPGNGGFYQLRPSATRTSSAIAPWHETTILAGDLRASGPLTVDASGNIYGTSQQIGSTGGVFELSSSQGQWTLNTLYTFQGGADGDSPVQGVLLAPDGNLYGTTLKGGSANCGTVFQLMHSGTNWTKTTLYEFQGGSAGCHPSSPFATDSAGTLYGATTTAPGSPSTLYALSPQGGGWTFSTLYSFNSAAASGSLALDSAGNLYGTTNSSIFKLTRNGGAWTYSSLHDFTCGMGADGCSPTGAAIDNNGNLFGTTEVGGPTNGLCADGCGTIWEVTP